MGAFRKRRQSLWSTGRNTTLQSGETQFKPQMLQSITGATSKGENGGMGWNNSMFCNEQINYAVRIVSLDPKFVHVNHRECNPNFERQNFRVQKIIFCPISNFKNKTGTLRFATARCCYGYEKSNLLPVTSAHALQYGFPAVACFSTKAKYFVWRSLHYVSINFHFHAIFMIISLFSEV